MATAARKGTDVMKTVERVGKELWSEGKVDSIADLYAEDCVVHAGPETYRGHDELAEWVRESREAFPDMSIELGEIFATDEFAATPWRLTGTHDGYSKLLDLEATGKKVDTSGVVCARFEDGKIVEEWNQADQVTMLAQLGVMEMPTA